MNDAVIRLSNGERGNRQGGTQASSTFWPVGAAMLESAVSQLRSDLRRPGLKAGAE